MKKTMFLSLGLLACVAFSPQPAFSAPDTGPKVDNIEVVNISASADQIMPEQGVSQVSITNNYFSTCVQASGQETVLHRSDHSVTGVNVDDFNMNKKVFLSSESKQLVNVGKYGDPQSWFDQRSRGDTKIGSNSENQNFNVISAASMAALHSHQMVRTMRRPPAWPIRPSRL